MTKRFPVPAALTAIASVLLGAADIFVASRVRPSDTPGVIVALLIAIIVPVFALGIFALFGP